MIDVAGQVAVPVVMSLWRRLPLLERTLHRLAHQEGVRPTLHLINNNPDIVRDVDAEVRRYRDRLSVRVTHGDNTLACFGRFVHARRIKNGSPFLVFIDDDQEFGNTFLRTLWDERTTGGITACHAYAFRRGCHYHQRGNVSPGERADYCGPGGMIIDARLLEQPALFDAPPDALIMDDLWLSYVANHVLEAPVFRSSATVRMTDARRDTWPALVRRKIDFLENLRCRGWAV